MADFPLAPGATLGILGGGQLGRMLALAGARLGFDVVILDPEPVSPAGRVAALEITADYEDEEALAQLAGSCDVVTLEFENVPAAALESLARLGAAVAPGPRALAVAQDRVEEKRFVAAVGAATVAFEAVDAEADARAAFAALGGGPALLKTRREGYDGKGQVWVRSADEAARAFTGFGGRPAILEARADFVRELSVIAARGRDGTVACYPPGENLHEGGVLRRTVAPAALRPQTRAEAESVARRLLQGLDYVGVLGVELFELADGRLLVNEIAPRVHNSGHWTQDAGVCDQFEQHVRAVVGWPLGPVDPARAVTMENLLGAEVERWSALAADPFARLHLYGKDEARPGRKMGHVNFVKPTRSDEN